MTVPNSMLEVREHNGPDYLPLVDFQTWRVAVMNYTPELVPEKIHRMQKHVETDEVFVLLQGRCILFLGEGAERVTRLHAADMQPFKLYNIKCGVWHSHTFSPDAKVLIVENCDTVDANSPFVELTSVQRQEIVALAGELWK